MTNLPSENATFSRHWWIHLCRWLWVRQGFVWGTIILGLVINVGAAWLTSKTSIFAGTPLGWFMRWVVEHSLAAAIIGLSLVLLIILVGVVSRLEVARVSIVETPEQQNRSRFLTRLHSCYNEALEHVPFLLVDRSPCPDPFLDPYASSQERRPIISGLCRCLKRFRRGDTYIYITRVDRRVCHALRLQTENAATSYLGIAALTVVRVHESHEAAAATFLSRPYVASPAPTSYPPNLAHDPHMPAAVLRESCIVSLKRGKSTIHCSPDRSTNAPWRQQVRFYHLRQKKGHLRAAECRLHQVDGHDALQLIPSHALVFTPANWGGAQMNVYGIELQVAMADWFCRAIACGR